MDDLVVKGDAFLLAECGSLGFRGIFAKEVEGFAATTTSTSIFPAFSELFNKFRTFTYISFWRVTTPVSYLDIAAGARSVPGMLARLRETNALFTFPTASFSDRRIFYRWFIWKRCIRFRDTVFSGTLDESGQ